MLSNIRIVLVNTSHPGNIGAAARAMKNMCLEQLVLVNPKDFPADEAFARASGARDLLHSARVVSSLEEAVADCQQVVGASARLRSMKWEELGPCESAKMLVEQARTGPVALVFGRERTGLTNEELDRCTHLVHLPANPDYSSLNVAMAVQVLAYEVRMASLSQEGELESGRERENLASGEQMEGLFSHLELALTDIGFLLRGREVHMMKRLRRLFYRAAPDEREVNILRGILSTVQGGKSMRTRKEKTDV